VEREVARILKEAGLEARRIPASGNRRAGWVGDLEASLPGLGVVPVEVKARKAFGLEKWLPEGGLLILKPDRRPALAVLPLEALLRLAGGQEGESEGRIRR
jgi:hypothetical protein